MDHDSKVTISSHSAGQLNNPAASISKKLGTSAWGIPLVGDGHQLSNNANLFSSSLPLLQHEKFNFNNLEQCGRFADDVSPDSIKLDSENKARDPFEDVETNTIGNLLPGDEDELLAGIMNGFDLSRLPNQIEDLEEYDVFGNGGGLELDSEPQESFWVSMSKLTLSDGVLANGIGHYAFPNGVGTVAGEHPYGEHPSRTLFVRNINSNVEDSELRSLFEVVRRVCLSCVVKILALDCYIFTYLIICMPCLCDDIYMP
uniref:Protein MEI2-like 2 isoform X2 n=1 Tax=Rhizophora mucronata TaxID=61149 RepID=A0A2P2LG66_RHIMU